MSGKQLTPRIKEEIGQLLYRVEGLGDFLGFTPNATWADFRHRYDVNGSFDLVRFLDDLERYQAWRDTRQQRGVTLKRLAMRLLDELEKSNDPQNKSVRCHVYEIMSGLECPRVKNAMLPERQKPSCGKCRSRTRKEGLHPKTATSWVRRLRVRPNQNTQALPARPNPKRRKASVMEHVALSLLATSQSNSPSPQPRGKALRAFKWGTWLAAAIFVALADLGIVGDWFFLRYLSGPDTFLGALVLNTALWLLAFWGLAHTFLKLHRTVQSDTIDPKPV